MTGIYLEIGQWKFSPVFGPTRQIVTARSMPNIVGGRLVLLLPLAGDGVFGGPRSLNVAVPG